MAASAAPDRLVETPQWSIGQVLGVWVVATVPMGLLAWVVAPWLADRSEGDDAMPKALILCLTAGLIWQFVIVIAAVYAEQGTLRRPVLREALWLRAPRSPDGSRHGGRLWIMLLPLVVVFGVEELVPPLPHPDERDLGVFLLSDAGETFFDGNWTWFLIVVLMALFNTVLGEELLFRGLLLPRMGGAFGRGDWVANGVLFALYHVHSPWFVPRALLDTFVLSYPSRRYRSALIGIIVHSAQSIVIVAVVLVLVV